MDHIIAYLGKESGSDIYKVYDPESNDMIYVHDGLTSEALLDKLANVDLFGAVGGTGRTNRSGGQEIYVNISSAIRIFQKGKEICANLLMELTRMQQSYEREVLGDDERRKRRLRQQIHQMEQNRICIIDNSSGKRYRSTTKDFCTRVYSGFATNDHRLFRRILSPISKRLKSNDDID